VCAGCVRFGGHRIAGLSGTYVDSHYNWGHHEKLPYDERMVKSVYHVRKLHIHRLMQVRARVLLGERGKGWVGGGMRHGGAGGGGGGLEGLLAAAVLVCCRHG
jgi:hypothetical protein